LRATEDFLRDIFGNRFGPAHAKREAIKCGLPPVVKRLERFSVTGHHES
jgi:hypothetical protein